MSLPAALRAALTHCLGEAGAVCDNTVLMSHAGDWSEAPHVPPTLLLLPRSPEQVAQALALCTQHRTPVVAQSLEDANRLWAYREAIGEMLGQIQPHAVFDIGIPMAEMACFVGVVREALQLRFPQRQHLFFGHIGDGNLHVLSGPHPTQAALQRSTPCANSRPCSTQREY